MHEESPTPYMSNQNAYSTSRCRITCNNPLYTCVCTTRHLHDRLTTHFQKCEYETLHQYHIYYIPPRHFVSVHSRDNLYSLTLGHRNTQVSRWVVLSQHLSNSLTIVERNVCSYTTYLKVAHPRRILFFTGRIAKGCSACEDVALTPMRS